MQTTNRTWHYAIWGLQLLLAAAFFMGGYLKASTPMLELAMQMPWVNALPPAMVRFIGWSEMAGSVGLVLPALTRFYTFLTPLAASCLCVVMVLASGFHASRGEYSMMPMNFVIGALAAFVAWGRFRKAPIANRGQKSGMPSEPKRKAS